CYSLSDQQLPTRRRVLVVALGHDLTRQPEVVMTEAVESQTGLVDPRKVVYFALGGTDDWVQSKPSSRPAERIPAAVRNSVDVDEYFREGLFTRRTQAGSFNLVEVKFAPNFIIPRHHHNFDQLVLVVEGSARQGKRWFH